MTAPQRPLIHPPELDPPPPDVVAAAAVVERIEAQVARLVVGQKAMIERLLVALLANGNVLLEGAPGLAKTLALTSIARCIRAAHSRIQFTPDLLPADLVGTQIYNPRTGDFTVRRGPIFANLVLADEINRAPAKVQSALLEAMQEQQVTIGEQTLTLPRPFLVMATQNPLEHEGTYPLPEAQTDRFMMKVVVGYPSPAEERLILERMATLAPDDAVDPVTDTEGIAACRAAIDQVHVSDAIKDYIVDIVVATRQPADYGLDFGPMVDFGASPRATVHLALAAKAYAVVRGRGYVLPQDVKEIGPDVLRHRLATNYEAEAAGVTADDLLRTLFRTLPVP